MYLRPFATTGKLPAPVKVSLEARGSWKLSEDMETFLAAAMEDSAPLVALGSPGEQIGAGRVATSDKNWKAVFERLASHAKVLFMLPGGTLGTQAEIDWIGQRLLWHKVIWLMPGEDVSTEWAKLWEDMRSEVRQRGLDLPRYQKCGMVFKMTERGKLGLFQPYGKKALGQIVAELMDGVGLEPTGENLKNLSPPAMVQAAPSDSDNGVWYILGGIVVFGVVGATLNSCGLIP
jgi:hypothetical protein